MQTVQEMLIARASELSYEKKLGELKDFLVENGFIEDDTNRYGLRDTKGLGIYAAVKLPPSTANQVFVEVDWKCSDGEWCNGTEMHSASNTIHDDIHVVKQFILDMVEGAISNCNYFTLD